MKDIFVQMIRERDEVKGAYNDQLALLLNDITFTAMFELFELENDAIEWAAIDLQDQLIVIVVNVKYTASETTSLFLKQMDKMANASAKALVRTLKVGIPLDIAFTTKEAVKAYLMDTAEKALGEKVRQMVAPARTEFDPSELTKEQLQQLQLYQHTNKAGEKQ